MVSYPNTSISLYHITVTVPFKEKIETDTDSGPRILVGAVQSLCWLVQLLPIEPHATDISSF